MCSGSWCLFSVLGQWVSRDPTGSHPKWAGYHQTWCPVLGRYSLSMPKSCVQRPRWHPVPGDKLGFSQGPSQNTLGAGGRGKVSPLVTLGLVGDSGCFLGLSGVWACSEAHLYTPRPWTPSHPMVPVLSIEARVPLH